MLHFHKMFISLISNKPSMLKCTFVYLCPFEDIKKIYENKKKTKIVS